MVTGDDAVCREGRELLGDGLVTVAVKRGLGRFSARKLPPRARGADRGGREARAREPRSRPAVRPRPPVRDQGRVPVRDLPTEKSRYRSGVEIVDPRTIVSRADDWWTAWRQFYF